MKHKILLKSLVNRCLYVYRGGVRKNSATQQKHETTKAKHLLTLLFILTACLGLAPKTTWAQSSMSYSQDFDSDSPTNWDIPSTMTVSSGVLQGTGTAALPTFDWTLSGARFGLIIKAGSGATNLEIGYLANPDDLESFTTFTTLPNIPAMNLSGSLSGSCALSSGNES